MVTELHSGSKKGFRYCIKLAKGGFVFFNISINIEVPSDELIEFVAF